MRLHLDIDGVDRVEEVFTGLHQRSTNLRPAFEAVGDDFRNVMGRVFSSRGAIVGGWAPLKTSTIAHKRRTRPNAPPGVFTGLLRASMTRKGARNSRQRIESDAITLGTRAPHAHLFRDGRKRQPARALIPSRTMLVRRWTPIIRGHVAGERPTTGII